MPYRLAPRATTHIDPMYSYYLLAHRPFVIRRSSFVAQRSIYAAEDKVLEYIKRVKPISHSSLTHLTSITQMNRPFGAVDVSANLKGAVPKTATQKILVALAEKGELVQKTYGTFHHSFFALRILGWMYAICVTD